MDGTAAISDNLEALKRILAGLVAMAGFTVLRAPAVTRTVLILRCEPSL